VCDRIDVLALSASEKRIDNGMKAVRPGQHRLKLGPTDFIDQVHRDQGRSRSAALTRGLLGALAIASTTLSALALLIIAAPTEKSALP
jgi:hypothetical protein